VEENLTRGVRTLLGDPRKAILKFSGPMIIGMLTQSLYNIVDGVWVAGMGSDALAAIGLFFPLFMVIISLAAGIGIGGSSTISRKIGAGNKELADAAASNTLGLGLIVAVVITFSFLPFLGRIFHSMGAKGEVAGMVISYSKVLLGGSVLIVFSNIAGGILRGEGDMRRAMYAMIIGSGLNIVLDPVFIYMLGMGVVGAAWATLFSIFVSSTFLFYWLFFKKDTYIDMKVFPFRFNASIVKEILRVGLPASFAQLSMAVSVFILNVIIVRVGGTDGVAVFTSAWRILMVGIVPLIGVAIGVTAVTGAAYGARDIEKLKTGYVYGVRFGVLIELGVLAVILIFARQISFIFTYSKGAAQIADDLAGAFRTLALFLPTVPLGMLTSSMFQGIGRGENSLAVTILRTLVMQVIFSYLFGVSFGFGINGVWWGIVLGNVAASLITFAWGNYTIATLKFSKGG